MLRNLPFLWVLPFTALADQPHKDNSSAEDNWQWIQPVPMTTEINRPIAKLGWVLFRDPNLSSNRAVSCESCHNLQTNGAETTNVSTGVNGKGIRNSLTVFNVANNYRFFWDGSANSLEEQINGPITNPVEMDSTWQQVEQYVRRSSRYQQLFMQIDNFDITSENIRYALAEFMRGLQTPNARFDQYLNGDLAALTTQEIRGWDTFQAVGCVQCHQGKNIGGNMIQKFGYFTDLNTDKDTGKHLVTDNAQDKFYFRVASLRNVADTPPYFHDGRTADLTRAIQIMAQGQLGITMDESTISDIEAFLHTLSAPRPKLLEEFESE